MCEKCQRSALIAGVRISLTEKPRLEIFAPSGPPAPLASIELESLNIALDLAGAISSVGTRLLGAEAVGARFSEIGSSQVDLGAPAGSPLN